MTHDRNDPALAKLTDDCDVVVLSIGYRLAPENTYPMGPEDVSRFLFASCTVFDRTNNLERFCGNIRFKSTSLRSIRWFGGMLTSQTCSAMMQRRGWWTTQRTGSGWSCNF